MPAERPLATTPPRARPRLARACDAGVPAAWVSGERVEGEQRTRRVWVEAHDHANGLAVSGQAEVWRAGRHPQVTTLLATLETEGW